MRKTLSNSRLITLDDKDSLSSAADFAEINVVLLRDCLFSRRKASTAAAMTCDTNFPAVEKCSSVFVFGTHTGNFVFSKDIRKMW